MSSDDDANKEYPCLVRVTDGEDAKFSTVVSTHDCILYIRNTYRSYC